MSAEEELIKQGIDPNRTVADVMTEFETRVRALEARAGITSMPAIAKTRFVADVMAEFEARIANAAAKLEADRAAAAERIGSLASPAAGETNAIIVDTRRWTGLRSVAEQRRQITASAPAVIAGIDIVLAMESDRGSNFNPLADALTGLRYELSELLGVIDDDDRMAASLDRAAAPFKRVLDAVNAGFFSLRSQPAVMIGIAMMMGYIFGLNLSSWALSAMALIQPKDDDDSSVD